MRAMTVYAGRVFANTGEDAIRKAVALYPSASRITCEPVMVLRQGIWWEYHAVFEKAVARQLVSGGGRVEAANPSERGIL